MAAFWIRTDTATLEEDFLELADVRMSKAPKDFDLALEGHRYVVHRVPTFVDASLHAAPLLELISLYDLHRVPTAFGLV